MPIVTGMRVFLACLFLPLNLSSAEPLGKKPNILFIAVDDLNDWVGPLGGIRR